MKIALEGKTQVIDVPDGATAEQIEAEARKFYTPEELSGQVPLSGGYQLEESEVATEIELPTTFAEREDYRIRRGRATVDVGKAYWWAMEGSIVDDVAHKIKADTMKDFTPENDKKFNANNWTERIIGATSELAPYMMDSALEGAYYGEMFGAAGAGAAIVGGQLGPQVALPEEVITAPIAYLGGRAVGQAWGAWRNAAMVEGGSIYGDLLEDGVDRKTAAQWAAPAGYLIGAIELLQVGQLFNRWIPGISKKAITSTIKRMASKTASKGLTKTLAKAGLTFGKEMALHTAFELTEEEAQEVVSIMAEIGANVIKDEADTEGYTGPDFDEAKMRLEETFKQGLYGFPLLGLPGSIYTTFSVHGREKVANRIMTQRAQEALNLDLADQIAEATKFDSLRDFQDSLDEKVDDKFANKYGFDNRTLFVEGVWNASRDVRGEDKIIEGLTKEGEITQPTGSEAAKTPIVAPTAKGGEIVAYHGTTADFDTFSPEHSQMGYHFGTEAQAKDRISGIKGGKVIKVKLNIKNPYNVVSDLGDWSDMEMLREYFGPANDGPFTKAEVNNFKTPNDFVDGLEKLGYDGIKYENAFENATEKASGKPAYIAFHPEQISKLSPKEGGGKKAKPSALISKEQAKGRVNKLIEDSNSLLKQIDTLERQKVRLEKAGKPIAALDTEIGKLAEKYDAMDIEIANIMTSDSVNLSEEKIQLKARELEAIEKKIQQAAKSEEKAGQKALQKEKSAKIAEIKQTLIDYANENLPTSERGVFLTAVMNVKTKKQLDKQIIRVNEYAEKAGKRGLVRQIKQQVKRIAASKSISVDYVQKIQDFINAYELQGHTEDTIKSLKATKAFIEKEGTAGRNVEMPSYILDALEILSRKSLDELTAADLQNVSDKVRVMADLGKTKLRSRRAVDKLMKARDLQAIVKDSKAVKSRQIKEGNVISGKLNAVDNFLNGVKKALNFAQMRDLVITPMDAVFDYLDNSKNYLGANYRIFKRRIDVAYSLYLEAKFAITQRVDAKANELKLEQDNMERIGLYAAKVQKGGVDKLLSFFTKEQIDSVVLADNEMEFYKFMRKELDALRPQIEKVMREVYNQPLGKVENYFPFMTDFEAMSDKEIRDRFGDKVITHYETLKKNVEMGFTKERVGGKNRIKLNAAEIFGSHIDNATYLINVGKETKYLGELARTDEYGQAVGDVGQEVVREWVDLIARKGIIQGERIKTLDAVRNYTGLVQLGFKISSTLVQLTSLMDGAALIGTHAFSGFKNMVVDSEWRAFVIDNMPELRNRIGDDIAFQDFKKDSWNKKIGEIAFAPLKTLDKFAACGVAAGAYTKYCEDNDIAIDLSNPNEEALIYAQKIMRRTQSSSQFKDLPLAITKGKLSGNISVDKLILQFQSFMLNRWSLIRHDLWRAGIEGGNKKQAANIAMWLIAANFAELGIRRWTKEMIAELTGQELPEEDEDKEFQKNLGQILQNVPFISQFYYGVIYGSLPVPSAAQVKSLFEKFGSAIKEEDEDEKFNKFIRAGLYALPGGAQAEGLIPKE